MSTTKTSGISMQPLFGKFKNLIVSETPFENGAFGALYLADLDGSKSIVRIVCFILFLCFLLFASLLAFQKVTQKPTPSL